MAEQIRDPANFRRERTASGRRNARDGPQPAFAVAYPGSFIDSSTANQVNLVVVPEPGIVSLLGGIGVLLGLRRRRGI